jgi:hypothetical protein
MGIEKGQRLRTHNHPIESGMKNSREHESVSSSRNPAVKRSVSLQANPFQAGVFDERDTVKKAQQGDGLAFDILYQRHKARVYRLCLRMVKNDALAEDLMQETFLQVFANCIPFAGKLRSRHGCTGWPPTRFLCTCANGGCPPFPWKIWNNRAEEKPQCSSPEVKIHGCGVAPTA